MNGARFFKYLPLRSRRIKKASPRSLYKTRFGFFLWLSNDSTYCVDRDIINTGLWEKETTAVIRKLVKPGDTFMDIGANIGYFTVLAARLVGSRGSVLAFEPTQYFRKTLQESLAANKETTNTTVFDVGLSHKQETLTISIGSATATLHAPGDAPIERTEKIKLFSLDTFVKIYPLKKLDFIKMDVDGHEPDVLKGAIKTLAKFTPTILLEVSHLHYWQAGTFAWDFYDYLHNLGYAIFSVEHNREIHSKVDFLITCGNFNTSANIVISKKKAFLREALCSK